MTIIKRAGLNRPLTWTELDGNFSEVESLKQQASSSVTQSQNYAQVAQSAASASSANLSQTEQYKNQAEQFAQQSEDAISRTLRAPDGDLLAELPTQRSGKMITFDENQQPLLIDKDKFAQLDDNGKVPVSQIPSAAITQVYVVDSETAMTSLGANVGDVAKRTDTGDTFILMQQPPTVLANWIQLSDDTISQLGLSSGSSLVGTTHRGKLSDDLNAIDRRPDGYGNSITSVLTNGNDVEINKDINITAPVLPSSNQQIKGTGGNIKQTTSTAAGVRVESSDSSNTKDYVTLLNYRSTGSTLSTEPGNEGYAVFLRNTKYNRIIGVLADRYTGGIAAGTSKSLIIRDVITHDTTFHPLNPSTRDGRGGYGVITDNISDTIIDGIIHDVGAVDNGRHVLYVSTGGYGNTTGNRNFIATNLIGKYLGKDDRNFWGVNVRKSTIFIVGPTTIDGSNGGVAFNAENGDITDFVLHGQQLDIIKYQDGLGVYGISTPKDATYLGTRFLISNFNIRVRPKDGTLTGADCVAISNSYQNGLITNGVTNVPGPSNPILINDGASNTTYSNIHDNILPGYTGTTAAMFAFTGSAVSNITVKNITTSRPMFARLGVVTDLTVDFQRKARISVATGVVSKVDTDTITGTVTLTSTGMTIAFPTHVTQSAIENCVVNCVGPYQAVITSYANKTLTLNTYTIAGVALNPTTTNVVLNVILFS